MAVVEIYEKALKNDTLWKKEEISLQDALKLNYFVVEFLTGAMGAWNPLV